MLGSWVAGLGSLAAVVFMLMQNRPSLIVRFVGITHIIVTNHKNTPCHITHIQLCVENSEDDKNDSLYMLFENTDLKIGDDLELTINPGQSSKFELNQMAIRNIYAKKDGFPHKYQIPRRFSKLKLKITVLGRSPIIADLPFNIYPAILESYYSYFLSRYKNISSYHRDLSTDEELKDISEHLTAYEMSKQNLKLPQTKRFFQILKR
jgi:hypothetical protein